ncbi:hypothetical protein B0A48_03175 [Cryoendolithus antarcticus]|uniref:Uncharacterized protein n=1 Tax=Cryoendolithus antarcticus TaxID=1507870 RepID=A0A1V8TJM5_9PEZI|nr:hypothetical protein B0A48_03175 [Cryoendolithus antarcticus]
MTFPLPQHRAYSVSKPAHEMSDFEQRPQNTSDEQTQDSSPSDASTSQPSSNGPPPPRSEKQKACDRLARVCWYLANDSGSASDVDQRQDLQIAINFFGFGLFGHEAFDASFRAQRDTVTSSSTGTRIVPESQQANVLPSTENVEGVRPAATVSSKAQVEKMLDSSMRAMARADGLGHGASSLNALLAMFRLQRPIVDPKRQKALDCLARACWYLPNDTGCLPSAIQRNLLYGTLWGFAHGAFDHDDFMRKLVRQRSTSTSSSTGTHSLVGPELYTELPAASRSQVTVDPGLASVAQRELMKWMYRTEEALQQAEGMGREVGREARSFGAIIDGWDFREFGDSLGWELTSDADDSSASIIDNAANGVSGRAHASSKGVS